jgi:hypothetical protein
MSQGSNYVGRSMRTSPRQDADRDREWRQQWIATYAYYLAEARGFSPANPLEDWQKAKHAYLEQVLAAVESY